MEQPSKKIIAERNIWAQLSYRTAEWTSTMEKKQSTRDSQQRIQPNRDIANIANWVSYSKEIIVFEESSQT